MDAENEDEDFDLLTHTPDGVEVSEEDVLELTDAIMMTHMPLHTGELKAAEENAYNIWVRIYGSGEESEKNYTSLINSL